LWGFGFRERKTDHGGKKVGDFHQPQLGKRLLFLTKLFLYEGKKRPFTKKKRKTRKKHI